MRSGKRESLWMIFVVRYTRVNGRISRDFLFLPLFFHDYEPILAQDKQAKEF